MFISEFYFEELFWNKDIQTSKKELSKIITDRDNLKKERKHILNRIRTFRNKKFKFGRNVRNKLPDADISNWGGNSKLQSLRNDLGRFDAAESKGKKLQKLNQQYYRLKRKLWGARAKKSAVIGGAAVAIGGGLLYGSAKLSDELKKKREQESK